MDDMDIEIIKIGAGDVKELQQLAIQTFRDAFAAFNTPENLQAYLHKAFSEQQLVQELNNPASAFYFAKTDGHAAGYVKLNTGAAQTDLRDQNGMEIERIYVLQAFHGRAVGQALADKAVGEAISKKAPHIWLGVWEHNQRAIRFYEKNGFVPFGTHVFTLGDDEQTDILMKRELAACEL